MTGRRGTVGLSGHGASILVAALSAAFGTALLQITGVLGAVMLATRLAESVTFTLVLQLLAFVFIAIAVYVGAIVTANTFATIVAGRVRTIALLRLIGASAVDQRRTVAREGLLVGVVGAAVGTLVGTVVAWGLASLAVTADWIPAFEYSWASPVLLAPVVGVVLTTWLASWIGSRRVLSVTPLQALGGSQELSREEVLSRPGRRVAAIVLMVLGVGALLLGVAVGLVHPLGVLIGVVGGIVSFTGLVVGAHLVMPPALRMVGRMLGGAASTRLAAENALRYPERSSRTTIGIVIGVTLITMFGVAMQTYGDMIRAAQASQPEVYAGVDAILDATTAVFSTLVGFSALIAAVGLINNLSLSVLQRTRELGLLRALGFSARQLRGMVLAESVQLTVTAVLLGLVLGTFYGWCGAQSVLGSVNGSPGLVAPSIPWPVFGAVVGAAAVLTVVASIAPARRATRVSPVAALAVE